MIYVISVAARLDYVSEVGPGPGFFRSGSASAWCLFAVWLDARILVDLREARLKANPNTWKADRSRPGAHGWRLMVADRVFSGRHRILP